MSPHYDSTPTLIFDDGCHEIVPGITCPEGEVCLGGECVPIPPTQTFPPPGITCGFQQFFFGGTCEIFPAPCPDGFYRLDNACVAFPDPDPLDEFTDLPETHICWVSVLVSEGTSDPPRREIETVEVYGSITGDPYVITSSSTSYTLAVPDELNFRTVTFNFPVASTISAFTYGCNPQRDCVVTAYFTFPPSFSCPLPGPSYFFDTTFTGLYGEIIAIRDHGEGPTTNCGGGFLSHWVEIETTAEGVLREFFYASATNPFILTDFSSPCGPTVVEPCDFRVVYKGVSRIGVRPLEPEFFTERTYERTVSSAPVDSLVIIDGVYHQEFANGDIVPVFTLSTTEFYEVTVESITPLCG